MRSIIAFCLGFILLLSFPAWAEENPLKGISGVRVFAYPSKDCETSGLTASSIQTEVELMLRQYGIKVLSQEEYKTQGAALSVIDEAHFEYSVSGRRQGYFARIRLQVEEYAYLTRTIGQADSPDPYFVTTWETNRMITGPSDSLINQSLEAIQLSVKEFANNYLQANQR